MTVEKKNRLANATQKIGKEWACNIRLEPKVKTFPRATSEIGYRQNFSEKTSDADNG
jgi:hypothetical protein